MPVEPTHREFSFVLSSLNLTDRAHTSTNPFTDEKLKSASGDELTDDQLDALAATFLDHGFGGPEDEDEGYAKYFENGGYIRMRCRDIEGGDEISTIAVEVVVEKIEEAHLDALIAVMKSGNMAATSSVGDQVRLFDQQPSEQVLERWPDAMHLSSKEELRNWIEDAIGGRDVRVPR